jgi:hypothetical protein
MDFALTPDQKKLAHVWGEATFALFKTTVAPVAAAAPVPVAAAAAAVFVPKDAPPPAPERSVETCACSAAFRGGAPCKNPNSTKMHKSKTKILYPGDKKTTLTPLCEECYKEWKKLPKPPMPEGGGGGGGGGGRKKKQKTEESAAAASKIPAFINQEDEEGGGGDIEEVVDKYSGEEEEEEEELCMEME